MACFHVSPYMKAKLSKECDYSVPVTGKVLLVWHRPVVLLGCCDHDVT